MCCHSLNPAEFSLERMENNYVRGTINPLSILSLERLEKLAELCDEIYHLFASIVIPYVNLSIKDMLFEIHHGIHHIEHLLHAFCFIGDIKRLIYCIRSGDFVEYVDEKRTKINYLRLAARVCYGVSHFFATANFLSEFNIVCFGGFRRVFKCASLIAALAHALLAVSVFCYRKDWYVSNSTQSIYQHPYSQLAMHVSGFLFEVFPWVGTIQIFLPYAFVIKKINALVGIIHAWLVINQGQVIEAWSRHRHTHCNNKDCH